MWDWPLQHTDGEVKVYNGDDKFEVALQVQFFKPNEIDVKVCTEELVISCRHESADPKLGKIAREVSIACDEKA
jgi:HSP20 family molecular chaperone IbpA